MQKSKDLPGAQARQRGDAADGASWDTWSLKTLAVRVIKTKVRAAEEYQWPRNSEWPNIAVTKRI